MQTLIGLAVIVVAIALAVELARRGKTKRSGSYIQADGLFTPAEREFLTVLDAAVGVRYRVFGKVRVADVLQVARIPDRSEWQRAFNKISAKHFDFVICRADDFSVVAAVELNDSSHRQEKRRARDEFLVQACKGAELPLLQVRARRAYEVHELRTQLAELLGIASKPPSIPV